MSNDPQGNDGSTDAFWKAQYKKLMGMQAKLKEIEAKLKGSGDFATSQDLNVPPSVAEKQVKILQSLQSKLNTGRDMRPVPQQDPKSDFTPDVPSTSSAPSTPSPVNTTDPFGLYNVVRGSGVKGRGSSGNLFPSVPVSTNVGIRPTVSTTATVGEKKVVEAVDNLVGTLKTRVVPALLKDKETPRTPTPTQGTQSVPTKKLEKPVEEKQKKAKAEPPPVRRVVRPSDDRVIKTDPVETVGLPARPIVPKRRTTGKPHEADQRREDTWRESIGKKLGFKFGKEGGLKGNDDAPKPVLDRLREFASKMLGKPVAPTNPVQGDWRASPPPPRSSSMQALGNRVADATNDASQPMLPLHAGEGGRGLRKLGFGMSRLKSGFDNFRVSPRGEGLSQVGSGMKAAVSSERFGDIGAGLMGAASGVATMAGGPVGIAAAGVFKFGEALMEGVEKLRHWTDSLHQSNMQFAEFSAAMSQVQAESEYRQIELASKRGDRRAETAGPLAEARDRLNEKFAYFEDQWANAKAAILTPILETLADGLQVVIDIYECLPWAKGRKEERQSDINAYSEAINEIMKNSPYGDSWGRPPRFPRR